jgi:hypothetical protein
MSAMVKHSIRYEMALPQHSESRCVYFVSDCACGWVSPLCESEGRAHDLFVAHQRQARKRRRRP